MIRRPRGNPSLPWVDRASAALYQFHVTGTLQDPRLTPVPVPALTRSAEAVFGHLATRGWQGDVLGETAAP